MAQSPLVGGAVDALAHGAIRALERGWAQGELGAGLGERLPGEQLLGPWRVPRARGAGADPGRQTDAPRSVRWSEAGVKVQVGLEAQGGDGDGWA